MTPPGLSLWVIQYFTSGKWDTAVGGGESLFLDAGTLKIFKFILESSSFRSENECLLFMAAATKG